MYICSIYVLFFLFIPFTFSFAEESASSFSAFAKADQLELSQAPSNQVLSTQSSFTSYYLNSFSSAKRHLLKLYRDRQRTFYCDCDFLSNKKIDASSCGYQVRKNPTRGNRVEWEHVVPAHRFGAARACWQVPSSFAACQRSNGKTLSGRKCCRKIDPVFREMEADMINLVPTVGELNADRSNYSFGLIEGEPRLYGQCDFEIDKRSRIAETKAEVRGDIARIYFYFAQKYELQLTEAELSRFTSWNESDPVSLWEIEKKRLVENLLVRVGKQRNTVPSFAEVSE